MRAFVCPAFAYLALDGQVRRDAARWDGVEGSVMLMVMIKVLFVMGNVLLVMEIVTLWWW